MNVRSRLAAFYFFYFASVGAVTPYFGLYFKSIGATVGQIGFFMALLQVMRMFSPNLWGHLADRHGCRKGLVVFAAMGSVIAFLGFFFTLDILVLIPLVAFFSFFWNAPLPLVEAATLNFLGARTTGYGHIRLWGSIGFILSVVSIGWLLDRIALTGLLWVTLLLLLGVAGLSLFLPVAGPLPAIGPVEQNLPFGTRTKIIVFLLACFFMSTAHGIYYAFYSVYLVDNGYNRAVVGMLWALGVLSEIGAFLVMPKLWERFGVRRLLLTAFLGAVLRFVLIGYAIGYPVLIVFAQTLHALTFAVFHTSAVTMIHRFFPGKSQARGQALYTSIGYGAGGSMGGLLGGWVWEASGPAVMFAMAGIFALLGFLLVKVGLKPVPNTGGALLNM
ncbi:MAG: MFS transporter [Proteobacteria bacterium]|nr:MFS transporter [Pseudomonadota bacterium]MDE3208184.1 MFS transporter [Pseudomonadota bacterium]